MELHHVNTFFLGQALGAGHGGAADAYGRWIQESGAGEWFVLAHLGFFFMLLACFGWAAWGIWRRTMRPAPHLKLLMELADEERAKEPEVMGPSEGEGSPWERTADWWKKGRS